MKRSCQKNSPTARSTTKPNIINVLTTYWWFTRVMETKPNITWSPAELVDRINTHVCDVLTRVECPRCHKTIIIKFEKSRIYRVFAFCRVRKSKFYMILNNHKKKKKKKIRILNTKHKQRHFDFWGKALNENKIKCVANREQAMGSSDIKLLHFHTFIYVSQAVPCIYTIHGVVLECEDYKCASRPQMMMMMVYDDLDIVVSYISEFRSWCVCANWIVGRTTMCPKRLFDDTAETQRWRDWSRVDGWPSEQAGWSPGFNFESPQKNIDISHSDSSKVHKEGWRSAHHQPKKNARIYRYTTPEIKCFLV